MVRARPDCGRAAPRSACSTTGCCVACGRSPLASSTPSREASADSTLRVHIGHLVAVFAVLLVVDIGQRAHEIAEGWMFCHVVDALTVEPYFASIAETFNVPLARHCAEALVKCDCHIVGYSTPVGTTRGRQALPRSCGMRRRNRPGALRLKRQRP